MRVVYRLLIVCDMLQHLMRRKYHLNSISIRMVDMDFPLQMKKRLITLPSCIQKLVHCSTKCYFGRVNITPPYNLLLSLIKVSVMITTETKVALYANKPM